MLTTVEYDYCNFGELFEERFILYNICNSLNLVEGGGGLYSERNLFIDL